MTLLQNIILSAQGLLMLMGSRGYSTYSYCYYPACLVVSTLAIASTRFDFQIAYSTYSKGVWGAVYLFYLLKLFSALHQSMLQNTEW